MDQKETYENDNNSTFNKRDKPEYSFVVVQINKEKLLKASWVLK